MDAAEFQRLTGASDGAVADLDRYRQMLEDGNAVMNLVGPTTLPDFWSRHALDSAQLLPWAPPAARVWADLGTGAGLPGVVLAILLKGVPGARVWLIDSLEKRCRFLSHVVSKLAIPAEVVCARAETISIQCDIVTSRACAPLGKLLDFADPYLKRGAIGLFLKGQKAELEIAEARYRHGFRAALLPSASDPRGRIVLIRSIQRAA